MVINNEVYLFCSLYCHNLSMGDVLEQLLEENCESTEGNDKLEEQSGENEKDDSSKGRRKLIRNKGGPSNPWDKGYSLRGNSNKDGLGSIMERGFAALQDTLISLNDNITGMADNIVEKLTDQDDYGYMDFEDDFDYEESEDLEKGESEHSPEPTSSASLKFDEITAELLDNEDTGAEVNAKLAKLVDGLMSQKQKEEAFSSRGKRYPRPKNCEFLTVPKMNTEIWSSIPTFAKNNDVALQRIQLHLIKSVTAVSSVIDKLNLVNDESSSEKFDANELLKTLVDSVAFAGAANRGIVRKRKDLVKFHLTPKFQKLCSKEEFTPSSLFGESLAQNVKEINDMGKISKDMANQFGRNLRGRGFGGRPRGRGWNRGGGYGYLRGNFHGKRKYIPYLAYRPRAYHRSDYYYDDRTRPSKSSKQSNSNTPRGKGGNSSSA